MRFNWFELYNILVKLITILPTHPISINKNFEAATSRLPPSHDGQNLYDISYTDIHL